MFVVIAALLTAKCGMQEAVNVYNLKRILEMSCRPALQPSNRAFSAHRSCRYLFVYVFQASRCAFLADRNASVYYQASRCKFKSIREPLQIALLDR